VANPYVKQTWTDGSGGGTPTSAARLGVIEQGIFDAHYKAAARVTHNAAQSVTNATNFALAFNTEIFDTESNAASTMHDTVTNNSRLTCRTAGIYQITGNIEWAANATGVRDVVIRSSVGGALIAYQRQAANALGVTVQQEVSALWQMAVNGYVELIAFQNSGAGLNVNSSASYSPIFQMVRVA
jgi:hypothetical protein